jgi:hypothetical protein
MKAFLRKAWAAMKGWKTMLVSIVIAVVGVLQSADWATIVSPQNVGPVMLGIGVLVAVLRAITSTPLGRRE